MNLSLHFSNIAFEDLNNAELLSELIFRGVITEADKSSLADFGIGLKIST
jgi:hypothetical protein